MQQGQYKICVKLLIKNEKTLAFISFLGKFKALYVIVHSYKIKSYVCVMQDYQCSMS